MSRAHLFSLPPSLIPIHPTNHSIHYITTCSSDDRTTSPHRSRTRSMMKSSALIVPMLLSSFLTFASGYTGIGFDDPMNRLILRAKRARGGAREETPTDEVGTYIPVTVGDQGGLMEADKIVMLPGQPEGVGFDQYSGYVTVDLEAGRALFYYFTEAAEDPATKPLVLWLRGGPGCSSFGNGAMMELGPFRINTDGRTLSLNNYSWNKVANIIFLESPAGVGYSYSNTTSDYDLSGDARTAHDSYTFLVNWLERFPHYKTRDLYIAGERYAGHFAPQLAHKILINNMITNQTVIKLRGIALGNAVIDEETYVRGAYDFLWTHALISDEIHEGITLNCNFSLVSQFSDVCQEYMKRAGESLGNIFYYDIYAPLCKPQPPTRTIGDFDPCIDKYINSYLNLPQVQQALHANVTSLPYPWTSCTSVIKKWNDSPMTVLPTIKQLMENNIRVWIYSGDTDSSVPVTSSMYSIKAFDQPVKTSWYPWYTEGEVGGYAVGYQKFAFVTVRGAGAFVPSYQPARALTLFSSFLDGRLPPRS